MCRSRLSAGDSHATGVMSHSCNPLFGMVPDGDLDDAIDIGAPIDDHYGFAALRFERERLNGVRQTGTCGIESPPALARGTRQRRKRPDPILGKGWLMARCFRCDAQMDKVRLAVALVQYSGEARLEGMHAQETKVYALCYRCHTNINGMLLTCNREARAKRQPPKPEDSEAWKNEADRSGPNGPKRKGK